MSKINGNLDLTGNLNLGIGYAEFSDTDTPATPSSGKVRFFLKSGTAELYQVDEFGIEQSALSASSGSNTGRKNYIINSDAESNVNNVTVTGSSITKSQTTDVSEVLRGSASFKFTFNNLTSGDVIDFSSNEFDQIDANRQNSISFDYDLTSSVENPFKVQVIDGSGNVINTTQDYFNGRANYINTFVANNLTDYTLRIKAEQNTASGTLIMDKVIVGPDEVVVGTPVSDWQAFDLTIDATTTAPTKVSSPDVDQGYWRRVGDSMEITYSYSHTGNGSPTNSDGSGIYLFNIPTGYQIDTSKIKENTDGYFGIVGAGQTRSTAEGIDTSIVSVHDSTSLVLSNYDGTRVSSSFKQLTGTEIAYSFIATFPIVNWDSKTILSHSRNEYVFNTDTDGVGDATNFGYGLGGALVPNKTGATGDQGPTKRVQLSKVYDHVILQVQPDGSGSWVNAGDMWPYIHDIDDVGTTRTSGIRLVKISDTQYDVQFGGAGSTEAGGNAWSTEQTNGTKWRVVGTSNPLAVETARKEYLAATSSTLTTATESVWLQMTGNYVTLTPGSWVLNGSVRLRNNGSYNGYSLAVGWFADNGDDSTSPPSNLPLLTLDAGNYRHEVYGDSDFTNARADINAPTVRISVTENTDVYLNVAPITNTGTGDYIAYIYAERIS